MATWLFAAAPVRASRQRPAGVHDGRSCHGIEHGASSKLYAAVLRAERQTSYSLKGWETLCTIPRDRPRRMSVRLRGAKPNSSIASIGGTLSAKKVGHFMFPFRPAQASLNYVGHDRTAGECGDPRSPCVGSADRWRAAAAAVTQAYISWHAGCTHTYVIHGQLQSENCPNRSIGR
jgi:hypothetical protein